MADKDTAKDTATAALNAAQDLDSVSVWVYLVTAIVYALIDIANAVREHNGDHNAS